MSLPINNTTVLKGEGLNISGAIWSFAAAISKIHSIWKIYIKGITYLNPDNFFGLSVGMIYQTIIGDRLFLKLPTVPFFVMARFLDLFEQEDAWRKQWNRWFETVQCVQPIHTSLTREYGNYKITWFHYSLSCLWVRIQRIAYATFLLAWESFKLVMRIMDIVELVTVDPAKLNEFVDRSVRESGLHIPRCLNVLIRNKAIFISRLESKESGINDALKWIGCEKLKAADVIDSAKSLFDHCQKGLELYQQAGDFVGDAIKNLGKKFIYEWSPDGIKQMLKEHHLDPQSEQQAQKQINFAGRVLRPPKDILRFGVRKAAQNSSPVFKNHDFSPKQNYFNPHKQKAFSSIPRKIIQFSM